ncbi:MAG: TAXI family TRAP transporter solute-binding subunit [Halanaerobiales bacterium]
MRRLIFLMMVLTLVLVSSSAFATEFISIATGGTGGTYYPLGGGMAEIFNNNLDNVNATAEVTGASVENSRLVQYGEVELAFVQNDVIYYGYTGTELFADEKLADVRGIATLYPEVIQIVTTEETGIDSIADFVGKRIAVGAPGSGTEANARQIITAYGLSYDDITVDYLSFAEAVDQLKDGHIDATFLTGGTPTAAVIDLAATHDVKILTVDGEGADKLLADYPFYTKHTIPANTYSGLDVDVDTVSVKAMLVTNSSLSEELVFNLTKALFENLDTLAEIHVKGSVIGLETAQDGMPIDLHPGAAKYYNEVAE